MRYPQGGGLLRFSGWSRWCEGQAGGGEAATVRLPSYAPDLNREDHEPSLPDDDQKTSVSAERQDFREELRLQAAERFARGEGSTAIAKDLRVSVRSVQRWRHAWAEGGPRSLRSQGPASLPRLSDQQFTQLEAELAKGPAAHGWEDPRCPGIDSIATSSINNKPPAACPYPVAITPRTRRSPCSSKRLPWPQHTHTRTGGRERA
ncbi:helix-turn-helix domain-containing protein [Streptomyces sp. NPDC057575]|uniref:helix-turn-helix domain-containing protein n=1 Tax=Streptomyces sp. NPDC057575 TaxID=3346170 RepID=UPI0036AC0CE2